MRGCVVVGCDRDAVVVAGKPTEWGAWEYWVCAEHKQEVDKGAYIDDQPDGRSIILIVAEAEPVPQPGRQRPGSAVSVTTRGDSSRV